MKTIIAATLILANTCATAGTTMTFRTLKSGQYAAVRPETATTVVIRNADQWETVVGGVAPDVDFGKEGVIVLFAGMKGTGGWWVEPKGVSMDGDVLVVDAPVRGPGRGDIVTQALTYPFAAIAVNTREFKSVRWSAAQAESRDVEK